MPDIVQIKQKIRQTCLNLLSAREHSQKELARKLKSKQFDSNLSKAIINELTEQGWQSDTRYAESYSRYRIQKGYGPIKILFELNQQGIDHFDINPVLQDLDEDWQSILNQVYEKKYPAETGITPQEWNKRYRFLTQRGFSNDMIKQLFKDLNLYMV